MAYWNILKGGPTSSKSQCCNSLVQLLSIFAADNLTEFCTRGAVPGSRGPMPKCTASSYGFTKNGFTATPESYRRMFDSLSISSELPSSST